MIYTLTFIPALDYTVYLSKFKWNDVNRPQDTSLTPGGKGINVSIMLQELAIKSKIIGFIAGDIGYMIEARLKEAGLNTAFIQTSGMSRINVQIVSRKETAINGFGPDLSQDALDQLSKKLARLDQNDILIVSGSIPKEVTTEYLHMLMDLLTSHGVTVIVDTSEKKLNAFLPFHPFLIKPNQQELEELVGYSCILMEDVLAAVYTLQHRGAQHVLVSLGEAGAILVTKDKTIYTQAAPIGSVIGTTGAGDSLLAGFIAEYFLHYDFKAALRRGVACGSATTFEKGLAPKKTIDAILKTLEKGA